MESRSCPPQTPQQVLGTTVAILTQHPAVLCKRFVKYLKILRSILVFSDGAAQARTEGSLYNQVLC